eukprot:239041-Prorocentrum_minimum.AAC.1
MAAPVAATAPLPSVSPEWREQGLKLLQTCEGGRFAKETYVFHSAPYSSNGKNRFAIIAGQHVVYLKAKNLMQSLDPRYRNTPYLLDWAVKRDDIATVCAFSTRISLKLRHPIEKANRESVRTLTIACNSKDGPKLQVALTSTLIAPEPPVPDPVPEPLANPLAKNKKSLSFKSLFGLGSEDPHSAEEILKGPAKTDKEKKKKRGYGAEPKIRDCRNGPQEAEIKAMFLQQAIEFREAGRPEEACKVLAQVKQLEANDLKAAGNDRGAKASLAQAKQLLSFNLRTFDHSDSEGFQVRMSAEQLLDT